MMLRKSENNNTIDTFDTTISSRKRDQHESESYTCEWQVFAKTKVKVLIPPLSQQFQIVATLQLLHYRC